MTLPRRDFLTTGAADVEGTYVWMSFIPFEEADLNPEASAYVKGVGADKADSFGAQAWQAGTLIAGIHFITTGVLSELLARIYFESGTIRSYAARPERPLNADEGWHKPA